MRKKKIEILKQLKRRIIETRNLVEIGVMDECVLDTFVWDEPAISQIIREVDESIAIIKSNINSCSASR